ncbi:hypothetical protein GLOTRDRAFT_112015 [Gloeophyllum trabeum ATCC 11539]|uniref:FAS1 domain-containing protein n=1 Tax=Gloeophyllum trabeum (strain ATCC 11539 / FP-39264 / Madison 617) TaxID=670483 RepID=S7PY73_GLOTA|nr:uncharacterized protein GLOTRDRAFT_112015 [Gloeophyllum trabeum ATCC 11539]EPQ52586.1 hypothetical protein GLOTRDRAFT_112015 [Gloeophyllum trabeum ATCC 11539]
MHLIHIVFLLLSWPPLILAQGPLLPFEAEGFLDAFVAFFRSKGFKDGVSIVESLPSKYIADFASLFNGSMTFLFPAFVPNATLNNLLNDTEKIFDVLAYHVVDTPLGNANIPVYPNHTVLPSALNDTASVLLRTGESQSMVLTRLTDGIIHVLEQGVTDINITSLDSFTIPGLNISYGYAVVSELLTAPGTLNDTLQALNITAFASNTHIANAIEETSTEPGITLFVPEDAGLVSEIASWAHLSTDSLDDIVNNHVINGTYYFKSLVGTLRNAADQELSFDGTTVTLKGGNTANITKSDVLTQNGVVHVIDKALLTSPLKSPASTSGDVTILCPTWASLLAVVVAGLFYAL